MEVVATFAAHVESKTNDDVDVVDDNNNNNNNGSNDVATSSITKFNNRSANLAHFKVEL